MNKLALALCLCFAGILSVSAQSVTVQFADGLEVQLGSAWSGVDAGADLPAEATVRLSSGGYAELARGDRVVALSRAGTYRLAELLKAAGAASSWGIGSVVNSKLTALGSSARGTEAQAAQMGVRGAAQGGGSITWVEDETGELLKRGISFLQEGKNSEALGAFQQASEGATDRESEEAALFYAAYTHDQMGQRAQAFRLLARIAPSPKADYYRDFVLLKGRLLIEGADANEALPLLDGYLAAYPSGQDAQAAQILASFAYRALGDNRSAVTRLEKARELAPATDLGRRADALIAEIR